MDTKSRFWSRLGGLGVVYAVLFVIAQALIGNGPGTGASGAAVVKYYRATAAWRSPGSSWLPSPSLLSASSWRALRRTLGRHEETGQCGQRHHHRWRRLHRRPPFDGRFVDRLGRRRALPPGRRGTDAHVLSNDLWVPVVTGLSVLALGTGVSALRTGGLPKWLGWVSVGARRPLSSGPAGAIAFLLAPVWALVVGIAILRAPIGMGLRWNLNRPVHAGEQLSVLGWRNTVS